MTPITLPFPREWTVDDLIRHLGGIPASRIRLSPPPGAAVEEDVLRVRAEQGKLCELIDSVLVEKTAGFHESTFAGWIVYLLYDYLQGNNLGSVTGPDGTMRLMPGQVRIPDVAFVSHQRQADCPTIGRPIPDLAPDLAIEVISENNTAEEIERKIKEYFFAGTALVWVADPRARTLQVWTAPDQSVTLDEGREVVGDPVLPGLRLPLARVFSRTHCTAPKRPRRKKKP